MKVIIDTPLNIGDCVYRVEFYNGEPDLDIESIGQVEIYGFSVDKDGIWIGSNEFGECCTKLDDIDGRKPDDYGFSYFSSKEKAVQFIGEYRDGKANN